MRKCSGLWGIQTRAHFIPWNAINPGNAEMCASPYDTLRSSSSSDTGVHNVSLSLSLSSYAMLCRGGIKRFKPQGREGKRNNKTTCLPAVQRHIFHKIDSDRRQLSLCIILCARNRRMQSTEPITAVNDLKILCKCCWIIKHLAVKPLSPEGKTQVRARQCGESTDNFQSHTPPCLLMSISF